MVRTIFDELDLGSEWIGAGNREDLTDPVGPWWHLAGALPFGGRDVSDASWQAGVLLLALLASGSTTTQR